MKYKIILTLIPVIATLVGICQPEIQIKGYEWQKVEALSDEFKKLDTEKWNYSLWNYPPPNVMKKSQVFVKAGKLNIKAQINEDSVRWMKTGRIMSKNKISFPMYTECRMKTAGFSAYNTFWLNNGDAQNRNEIDICENNANPSNRNVAHGIEEKPYLMQSNIHHAVDGVNKTNPKFASTKLLSPKNKNRGKKTNETFHTYGLYWEDERNCHFYLDGEYVGSSLSPRKFTRELHIFFGLWTNKWDGFPEKIDLMDDKNNTMYVDWIYTYKLVPEKEL